MNYFDSIYNPYLRQQPQNNGIQWVQGEEAAKSFMVAPGKSVLLMDSEKQQFYIKSADASGMPMPLRVFEYTERPQSAPASPTINATATGDYITREEFERRISEISKREEDTDERFVQRTGRNARAITNDADA